MSSQEGIELKNSEKDLEYATRLVYDVMVYTLPKCGFPEVELPRTDYKENVYNRANFVEIAGVSALRISLVLRDKWKTFFFSRKKSSGFSEDELAEFLHDVLFCCPLSWKDTEQSLVEGLLALCNELIMFFRHEGIDIDPNIVLNSTSMYIGGVILQNRNNPKSIEEFFSKFDNISEYTRWITDFMKDFAVPYGSRDNVSELFFKHVRKQWTDCLQMSSFPKTPTTMLDYLGFLPDDLFVDIEYDTYGDLPENMAFASKSNVPGDHKSSDPQKSPSSPESDALSGQKSHGSQSVSLANESQETAEGGENSKNSSELGIEKDLLEMSFRADQPFQERQGTTAQPKKITR